MFQSHYLVDRLRSGCTLSQSRTGHLNPFLSSLYRSLLEQLNSKHHLHPKENPYLFGIMEAIETLCVQVTERVLEAEQLAQEVLKIAKQTLFYVQYPIIYPIFFPQPPSPTQGKIIIHYVRHAQVRRCRLAPFSDLTRRILTVIRHTIMSKKTVQKKSRSSTATNPAWGQARLEPEGNLYVNEQHYPHSLLASHKNYPDSTGCIRRAHCSRVEDRGISGLARARNGTCKYWDQS